MCSLSFHKERPARQPPQFNQQSQSFPQQQPTGLQQARFNPQQAQFNSQQGQFNNQQQQQPRQLSRADVTALQQQEDALSDIIALQKSLNFPSQS